MMLESMANPKRLVLSRARIAAIAGNHGYNQDFRPKRVDFSLGNIKFNAWQHLRHRYVQGKLVLRNKTKHL